jgi:hypothetical protein
MIDPLHSHLYYSKVELSFDCSGGAVSERAARQACDLMDRVLTELVSAHWPEDATEQGEKTAEAESDNSKDAS